MIECLGYVPRLQEHFGRGYVDTTVEALNDFQNMLEARDGVPPKLAYLHSKARERNSNANKPSGFESEKLPAIDGKIFSFL